MISSFFLLLFLLLFGQQEQNSSIQVAFYNPENIFDTINDPRTNDEEFTPTGKSKWDNIKYDTKLKHTARVVTAINNGKGADIIGFSEIENKNVLVDLTTKTELKKYNYEIVHHDSPDERGIDVALIYKKDVFKLRESIAFNIKFPFDTLERTRDILLIKGEVKKNKSKLYIILNHWPSRLGGEVKSEPKRIFVAARVRQIIDSISKIENDISFVIMGDFNDGPSNKSIKDALKTVSDTLTCNAYSLYNTMNHLEKEGKGTHYYRGEKNILDQIIISTNLLTAAKLYTHTNSSAIFEADWLMERNPKTGEIQPFRTFAGGKYLGGYSDHLPIYITLYCK